MISPVMQKAKRDLTHKSPQNHYRPALRAGVDRGDDIAPLSSTQIDSVSGVGSLFVVNDPVSHFTEYSSVSVPKMTHKTTAFGECQTDFADALQKRCKFTRTVVCRYYPALAENRIQVCVVSHVTGQPIWPLKNYFRRYKNSSGQKISSMLGCGKRGY